MPAFHLETQSSMKNIRNQLINRYTALYTQGKLCALKNNFYRLPLGGFSFYLKLKFFFGSQRKVNKFIALN